MTQVRTVISALLISPLALLPFAAQACAGGGELRMTVIDKKTGQPVPCRMHLKTAAGKPRPQKPFPFWYDHFVFPGKIKLRLPRGQYTFEIERGPEFTDCTGHFIVEDHADDEKTVELTRAVDMAAEGWWSADLHVERPARDLDLLMEADDLHVAVNQANNSASAQANPATSSPVAFGDDRFFIFAGRRDDRAGNDLLYFARQGLVSFPDSALARTSPLDLVRAAKTADSVWLDVSAAFSWDLPILVAQGMVDSIELANDHLCRRQVMNSEGEARHRDAKQLPAPFGNALWSQQIYYHLLNCGLRIPPTAGSGSGAAPNPVGYNRVYVYLGDKLDLDAWWQALRAGKVMVTNGPLIRPNVRGQLPGFVFTASAGEELSLGVSLSLSIRDPVSYLEIIKNGEVERSVPINEWAKSGSLAPLTFKESGWFLIRAVTDVETTYRFGSTGPYYVEIGDKPKRISRASAQFFLDWTRQRAERVRSSPSFKTTDLHYYDQAIDYWQNLVHQANAP